MCGVSHQLLVQVYIRVDRKKKVFVFHTSYSAGNLLLVEQRLEQSYPGIEKLTLKIRLKYNFRLEFSISKFVYLRYKR